MDSFPAGLVPQAGCLLVWGLLLLEGRCPEWWKSCSPPGCLERNGVSCLFGGKFPSKCDPVWGESMFPGKPCLGPQH